MHVNELYCILNEMKWKKRRSIYDTQFTDTQPPLHEYYYYYVEIAIIILLIGIIWTLWLLPIILC